MTACVNKKSKRVAAVVTASLVGALSIGAPAVALAANANIDFQVAPAEDAFSRGKLTLSGTNLMGDGSAKDPYTIKALGSGEALDVKASEVTPLGADNPITVNDTEFEVVFSKADGTVVKDIVEPGNYVVTVKALKGVYAGSSVSTKLAVTAADLQNVSVFEVDSTVEDNTTDTKLVYTGSEIKVGFADKVAFVEGKDYTVKVLKAGTDNVSTAPGVAVLEAGDYVAYLTGMGQYAGQTKEVPFKVHPFVISDTDQIVVDDVIASDAAPSKPSKVHVGTIGTADYAELDTSLVSLKFKSDSQGNEDVLFDKAGAYKFAFTVNAEAKNVNVTVPAEQRIVDVHKISAYATYQYDGAALKDSYYVNRAKKESFDLSLLKVYGGETLLSADKYDVKVSKEGVTNGTDMDLLAQNKPGNYTVTVTVKPDSNNHQYGGSATFSVKIVKDVVDADANVFVYDAKGEVVTSFEKTYDGEAFDFSRLTVKAFNDKGEAIKDITLSLELLDSEGKVVTEAKNAGSYTLKVVSDKLELNGETELPVIINKVDLSTLKVNSLVPHFGAAYLPLNDSGYSYSELDLRFDTHVADSDENDKAADKEGWDALTFGTWGSKTKFEMFDEAKGEWVSVTPGKAEGVVRVTLSGDKNDAVNYKFANADNTTVVEFLVTDANKVIFNDVKPGDWFFDVVFDAWDNDWMNGYADGVLFGAHDQITRGQVACVLFNMAGGEDMNETDGSFNEVFGWKSFSDVDGKAYYGEAIAWAKQAGVVNGYGDGTFRPDAPVTREELACMLANYAKKVDQADVSVEDADKVLSSMSDGASVSDWAKGSVAWAVENEIMGNAGFVNALSDITRAETAAMVVNYMA